MGKRKIGECAYCGVMGPLTHDHIPPRCLFSRSARLNLITVPSCGPCNAAGKKEDEYFRNVLALREDVVDEPDIIDVLPRALRALRRPQAQGMRTAFLDQTSIVHRVTPAGVYLGTRMVYSVDIQCVNAVAKRITRGLYFRHAGHRTPDVTETAAFAVVGIQQVDRQTRETVLANMSRIATSAPVRAVGQAFAYAFDIVPDGLYAVFLMLFYRKVLFLGLVSPRASDSGSEANAATDTLVQRTIRTVLPQRRCDFGFSIGMDHLRPVSQRYVHPSPETVELAYERMQALNGSKPGARFGVPTKLPTAQAVKVGGAS